MFSSYADKNSGEYIAAGPVRLDICKLGVRLCHGPITSRLASVSRLREIDLQNGISVPLVDLLMQGLEINS